MHCRTRTDVQGLIRHLAITALAIQAGAALAAAQSTWHVDIQGTSPGTGSASDPYTSVSYAISRPTTVSGDRILVRPGTYPGAVNYGSKVLTVESTEGPTVTHIAGHVLLGDDVVISNSRLVGFRVDSVALLGASLERCVMIGSGSGQAIFFADLARIEHCTIVNFGLALQEFAFNGYPLTVRNSVFEGNATLINTLSGQPHVLHYCAGQAGASFPSWDVVGNVPGDPGLWSLAGGDVFLRPTSPCIDAGDPTSPTDPDGSRADIGALPFLPDYDPMPSTYCVGKLNGQGCVPSMSWTGQCSASSGLPFHVTASQVSSHKFGRLFYGFAAAAIPFAGGTKCIAPPTTRTALFDSGGDSSPCSGALSFDFNARIASGVDPALVPGRTVYVQYWYRDPADPAGYGIGLSNALRFSIGL